MAESYSRLKDGFRFSFGGMKVNASAEALAPNKYPLAINVRSTRDNTTHVRPGQSLRLTTGAGNPITDIGTSAALGTDDLPRIFARDSTDKIYLDDNSLVGVLAGGGLGPGTVMLPFRPNQSPTPYMYMANGSDYQKLSIPGPNNAVVAKKVGIAEPQSPPDAGNTPQTFVEVTPPVGSLWITGGTASGLTSGDRSSDQIVDAFQDPAQPLRWSLWVGTGVQYQRGEVINFTGSVPQQVIVEDVIPPLSLTLTIAAIFYFAGNSGRCIVVPQGLSAPNPRPGQSMFTEELVAQLRRGSLIQIGSEPCFVSSIAVGPNGQVSIETLTTVAHAAGETITGLSAIIVNGINNPSAVATGAPIIGDQARVQNFSATAGIATVTMGSVGGPAGTVIARPSPILNGWGPNGHVGAYELGQNQGFNWGLDPGTTNAYTNPANVSDGDITTFASASFQHTHQYAGCVWKFSFVGPPPSNFLTLNINSAIPSNGSGGLVITVRSAGIWYSLDNGTSWQQVYNQGPRAQQWDTISLPAGQNLNNVQVMAFLDSHDDMTQFVYEINITSAPSNPVLSSVGAFQEDDYVHFSLKVSDLTKLTEAKILFDVGDGSFTQNFYYYSVRPSDIVAAVNNATTQLSLAQILLQRKAIAEEAMGKNESIPADSVAGNNQWSEIWFPIAEFIRVGGDMTRTLANAQGVQFLFNCSGAITAAFSSLCLVGGGQPDVGDVGAPLLYRVRPRDSRTGATGNPSPATRYGSTPRRQAVAITLPNPTYDQQIDTWDIFRYGGAVTSWRYIGSTPALPVNGAQFTDNYDDAAAQGGHVLDFDNFEPWPSVDVPLAATASQVIGTTALVTIPGATNAARFLPGNLVQIAGQNVYTLWTRPIQVTGGVYLFQFVENAGFAANVTVAIYEPDLARQFLPYMWGPDVAGRVFAVGDPLRAGTLYFSKDNNPDSAPDRAIEICPPSEPLIGGEVVDGLSFVGSPERWWALYPQDNPAQPYAFVQQPIERGLAAPYGHCNDNTQIFFWAKDGIRSTKQGSLTDEDLYNLFPHEGVPGRQVTYNGVTITPPDYSRAGTFRLAYANYYLYATYQDLTGAYQCMTLNTKTRAWCVDQYTPAVSAFYHPAQQAGTLLSNTQLYDELLMGTKDGRVAAQADLANDLSGPITCTLAVFEFDGGDLRAGEQWGDVFLDCIPACKGIPPFTVSPLSLGIQVAGTTGIASSTTRTQLPISVGGSLLANFLGMLLTWTDDFSQQATATILFSWQPSFIPKPEIINDRVTDWDDAGSDGAKWFQGFMLHADTFNKSLPLNVRDAESLILHPFTPSPVIHNGESEIAYSFVNPFIAHMVRLEPNSSPVIAWRLWGVRWIAEPSPSFADVWQTQGTSFGLKGYLHIRQIAAAYASMGDAILTITTFDGQPPQPILLPSTNGVMQKVSFSLTANKGQLYFFRVAAVNPNAQLRLFLPDWEVLVGEWGRTTEYGNWAGLGGEKGDKAAI